MATTFLTLADVPDSPRVRIELPELRIGDRLALRFQLTRQHNGRREVLDVQGEYRVTGTLADTSHGAPRQILHVEATGLTPSWKAVKNQVAKRLGTCRFPRTPIG
jgi:hypothetical protein